MAEGCEWHRGQKLLFAGYCERKKKKIRDTYLSLTLYKNASAFMFPLTY